MADPTNPDRSKAEKRLPLALPDTKIGTILFILFYLKG